MTGAGVDSSWLRSSPERRVPQETHDDRAGSFSAPHQAHRFILVILPPAGRGSGGSGGRPGGARPNPPMGYRLR